MQAVQRKRKRAPTPPSPPSPVGFRPPRIVRQKRVEQQAAQVAEERHYADLALRLFEDGYVVLRDEGLCSKVDENHQEFLEMLGNLPEYRRKNPGSHCTPENQPIQYAMGGFGALGVASQFHGSFVRRMRSECMAAVLPLLKAYVDRYMIPYATKVEQLVDRVLYRRVGTKPSSETWHRDESPGRRPGDVILGGWINLNPPGSRQSQHFSCAPGTHRRNHPASDGSNTTTGFSPIDGTKVAQFRQRCQDVEVPPGHILLFVQELAHKVRGRKLRHDEHRLFLGWRLTYADQPLSVMAYDRLDRHAVVPLKSGQMPPMYALMHWANWTDRLAEWSRSCLISDMLCQRKVESGKRAGKMFCVPKRYAPSLPSLGLGDRYPAYQPFELQMHRPTRGPWILQQPGVPGTGRLVPAWDSGK